MSVKSVKEIQVLDTMTAIRKRPRMYVGDLHDPLTATRILQEALCMPIAAGFEGKATRVSVSLFPNGRAIVSDDGEGWPVDVRTYPNGQEISTAELYMTALFGCRDAKDPSTKGLCNNGIVMVNALSIECHLRIMKDGIAWGQTYDRGVPRHPLEQDGKTLRHGTTLEFRLDPAILPLREFDLDALVVYCTETGGIHYDIDQYRNVIIPKAAP
jgi:DNA gyrase subunit B